MVFRDFRSNYRVFLRIYRPLEHADHKSPVPLEHTDQPLEHTDRPLEHTDQGKQNH